MEATGMNRAHNEILELAAQAVPGKMEEAGRQIFESLAEGSVHEATEAVRDLSAWFEAKVWTAYFNSLRGSASQCQSGGSASRTGGGASWNEKARGQG